MFTYNISKVADKKAFSDTCAAIESKIPQILKEDFLEDVDDTTIQIYSANGKKIKVFNDYEVDAVYIDSEIDLSEVFK